MAPITKAQRKALKAIFDRRHLYPEHRSSDEIAQAHGWRYIEAVPGSYVDKDGRPYTHVWAHEGKYTPLYLDSEDIVADYKLAERLTYRTFRKNNTHVSRDGTVMVRWFSLWLGVELDGYTHS